MVIVGTKRVPTGNTWTLPLTDGGVWSVKVKRQIAEESFEGNSSVAQLAQKHAVNANQIFKWRKNYREEGLKNSHSVSLLPVTVSREAVVEAANSGNRSCQTPIAG